MARAEHIALALKDDPHYVKVLQRRAAANEKIGSWTSLSSAQEGMFRIHVLCSPRLRLEHGRLQHTSDRTSRRCAAESRRKAGPCIIEATNRSGAESRDGRDAGQVEGAGEQHPRYVIRSRLGPRGCRLTCWYLQGDSVCRQITSNSLPMEREDIR